MGEIELSREPTIRGCQEACLRCGVLVQHLAAGQYAAAVEGHSSIGAHMRHCIDHYTCFFRGLGRGRIDYDHRERNTDLERDPAVFHEFNLQVLEQLRTLEVMDLQRPLTVHVTPAADQAPRPFASTTERELVFLSSHTIHHLAVMSLLAHMLGNRLPDGIGVAYSTAVYQAGRAADAAHDSD